MLRLFFSPRDGTKPDHGFVERPLSAQTSGICQLTTANLDKGEQLSHIASRADKIESFVMRFDDIR